MSERGFEGLKVWQRSHQLMLDIHRQLIPLLPKEERFGLTDQIRRSSKSVGANIAEGYGMSVFVITRVVHSMKHSIIFVLLRI